MIDKANKGDPKGFTLVEVMVLVTVMFTVIWGASEMTSRLLKNSMHQDRLWLAGNLGEIVMEELLFSYKTSDDLKAGSHLRYYSSDLKRSPTPTDLRAEWTVAYDSPTVGVINIQLKIFWQENSLEKSTSFFVYR